MHAGLFTCNTALKLAGILDFYLLIGNFSFKNLIQKYE